jgi:hypothetical protein
MVQHRRCTIEQPHGARVTAPALDALVMSVSPMSLPGIAMSIFAQNGEKWYWCIAFGLSSGSFTDRS